jgi:hypothetical protein
VDGGAAGSQSPVQSGAVEDIQMYDERMDLPESRLARIAEISCCALGREIGGAPGKSEFGCHQPSAQAVNDLINFMNVFKLAPLLPLPPLVPRRVVYALE